MNYKNVNEAIKILNFITLPQNEGSQTKATWWLKNQTSKSLIEILDNYKKECDLIDADNILTDEKGAIVFEQIKDPSGNVVGERPAISKENLKNRNSLKNALFIKELEVTEIKKANWDTLSEVQKQILNYDGDKSTYYALEILFLNLPIFQEKPEPTFEESVIIPDNISTPIIPIETEILQNSQDVL